MSDIIIQQNTHIIQECMYDVVGMNNFGEWLRKTREEKRISGADLSKMSGVSRQYISNLERELRTDVQQKLVQPSIEKVDALAKALGADISEARHVAGYATKNGIPDFLKKIDFTVFTDDEIGDIKDYIDFKIWQKGLKEVDTRRFDINGKELALSSKVEIQAENEEEIKKKITDKLAGKKSVTKKKVA